MAQIKYKYLPEDKKLQFSWNENDKLDILIEKDEDINIVKLYDYIISNIQKINFEDETDEKDKTESVHYKASEEIVNSIKEETKIILNKYKELTIN